MHSSSKANNIALINAVKKGNLIGVISSIKHGANVETLDYNGDSALIIAIKTKHVAIVKILLEARANVDLSGKNGIKPLKLVITNYKMDVNTMDREKDKQIIDSIIQTIRNEDNDLSLKTLTPISFIASRLIRAMENSEKDILNLPSLSPIVKEFGFKMLCNAIFNNQDKAAKWLIDHKAPVEIKESNIQPILIACIKKNALIVKMLLENGASVDISSTNGLTPLLIATGNGSLEIVDILLQYNADISLTIRETTALMIASLSPSQEIFQMLQRHQDTKVNLITYEPETSQNTSPFLKYIEEWASSPYTQFNFGTLTGNLILSPVIKGLDDYITNSNQDRTWSEYYSHYSKAIEKFAVSSAIQLILTESHIGTINKLILSKTISDLIIEGIYPSVENAKETLNYLIGNLLIQACVAKLIPQKFYEDYPFTTGVITSNILSSAQLIYHLGELGYNNYWNEEN